MTASPVLAVFQIYTGQSEIAAEICSAVPNTYSTIYIHRNEPSVCRRLLHFSFAANQPGLSFARAEVSRADVTIFERERRKKVSLLLEIPFWPFLFFPSLE